jgi:hypothetical protein
VLASHAYDRSWLAALGRDLFDQHVPKPAGAEDAGLRDGHIRALTPAGKAAA